MKKDGFIKPSDIRKDGLLKASKLRERELLTNRNKQTQATLVRSRDVLHGLLKHLGPNGYIPGAGATATREAQVALADLNKLIKSKSTADYLF